MSIPITFSSIPYMLHDGINAFFLYSLLGWCMECVVIRRERGHWENRGFVRLPFCIIYGFGSMLGYAILKPFSSNYILLFCAGAVCATLFEYLTGRLMLRLFGTLWWDYSDKPFNYQGILCLESTLGWGVVAILLFTALERFVFGIVARIPDNLGMSIAGILVIAYAIDFTVSARAALANRNTDSEIHHVESD